MSVADVVDHRLRHVSFVVDPAVTLEDHLAGLVATLLALVVTCVISVAF